MKNRILMVLILISSVINVYSQRNITQEEYHKIITTNAYYWGRSDFDLPLDAAKAQACEELINQISEFEKSINENDLLKRANYVKFEVEGNRTRIIFYIAKDSLYVERIVDTKPIEKEPVKENIIDIVQQKEGAKKLYIIEEMQGVKPEETTEALTSKIEIAKTESESKHVPIESDNEIIATLSQITDFNNFCTQLNRYKRKGKIYDSQSGTAPDVLENCIMAIFKDDILKALYDRGSVSRKDFLTGQTVQKPEDNYLIDSKCKVIFIKIK